MKTTLKVIQMQKNTFYLFVRQSENSKLVSQKYDGCFPQITFKRRLARPTLPCWSSINELFFKTFVPRLFEK